MLKTNKYLALLVLLVVFTACQNKKSPQTTTYIAPPAEKGLKTVYYDFDKSNIRDDQLAVLESNGNYLKSNSTRVTIEGHCDERGTNEYNMALGDRRARSAKSFLVNLGIDESRMSTISYGEDRPVGMCHDESCWWQNRRAEFTK